MYVEEKQLKKFLINFNLLSEKDFDKAQKKAGKENEKLENILIGEKFIEKDDLLHLKAYVLGIPFIDLEKEKIPIDTLKIIPEPIARKHNIVAYRKKGKNLEVAMLNPEDLQTIEFIKKKANLKVSPRLTTLESIKSALMQYEESLETEFENMIKRKEGDLNGVEMIERKKPKKKEKEELAKAAGEMPIIRIVDTLLKHSILQHASDVHIEPGEKEIVIRYRIDGVLHDAMILPYRVYHGIVARIKVLACLKLDEHRLPQDGRFKIKTKDYKISFRVSILPTFLGEKIVMRLLPETSRVTTLEELGFAGEVLEKIHFNIKRPNGLILITGPTGCGKTTTLYSIMDILNIPEVNISTIEDPVEYTMPRINQTQVKPQIGLTFANGLRALVRQDPDIIMVGEIRDNETASLAINAALTGHLVLSTLHTNSAAGAIPRLLDMKVEAFLIASTLKLVIAQRLVRRLCLRTNKHILDEVEIKNLSKRYDTNKILNILKKEKTIQKNQSWQDIEFGMPKETENCLEGYKGRCGISEVLQISESVKELIIKEETTGKIQERAEKEGMVNMIEDGFVKAVRKITSIEEVFRVTRED